MEQCIYRDKSTSRTVRKTWTLNELQSCVIADESINQYYKKNWKNSTKRWEKNEEKLKSSKNGKN